jgi:hypothetical protein
MKNYDYILQARVLALMTVYTSGKFADKSILLIDSDSRKKERSYLVFSGKKDLRRTIRH